MAIPTLNAVGFCAHYSREGDWAFDFALEISRQHGIRLNVFHFLSDPYDPEAVSLTYLSAEELNAYVVRQEKELRMYYDDRAGDYLEVGFRLCHDNEWVELHRCLVGREFQLLILGHPGPHATFGNKPLEEFANSFVCPVILVGPDHPRQFQLNSTAALISDRLGLPEGTWEQMESAAR